MGRKRAIEIDKKREEMRERERERGRYREKERDTYTLRSKPVLKIQMNNSQNII